MNSGTWTVEHEREEQHSILYMSLVYLPLELVCIICKAMLLTLVTYTPGESGSAAEQLYEPSSDSEELMRCNTCPPNKTLNLWKEWEDKLVIKLF